LLAAGRDLSYEDLARVAEAAAGAEPPSILRSIFHEANSDDEILAAWLASAALDPEIVEKQATGELLKLIHAHLALELVADHPFPKLRAITLRYVLAGEFRLDLSCDPPPTLESVP